MRKTLVVTILTTEYGLCGVLHLEKRRNKAMRAGVSLTEKKQRRTGTAKQTLQKGPVAFSSRGASKAATEIALLLDFLQFIVHNNM